MNEIWIRSIVALMFIADQQEIKDPLHLLSITKVQKVRNKGGELVWGDGDGYCDARRMILANVNVMSWRVDQLVSL
jgi:hypothetical protein